MNMRNAFAVGGLVLVVAVGTGYVFFGRKPAPQPQVIAKVVPAASPRTESARVFSVAAPVREPDAIAKLTTTSVPPQMTPGRWPDVPRPPQAVPNPSRSGAAAKAEKPKVKQPIKAKPKSA